MPVFVQQCDLCRETFPEGDGQVTAEYVVCPACIEKFKASKGVQASKRVEVDLDEPNKPELGGEG